MDMEEGSCRTLTQSKALLFKVSSLIHFSSGVCCPKRERLIYCVVDEMTFVFALLIGIFLGEVNVEVVSNVLEFEESRRARQRVGKGAKIFDDRAAIF